MDNGLLLVNFGALHQAGADIQKALNQLHTQLSDLDRDAAPLVATWSGAAQAAYSERQRKWTAAADDLAADGLLVLPAFVEPHRRDSMKENQPG